jgi:zinc protease
VNGRGGATALAPAVLAGVLSAGSALAAAPAREITLPPIDRFTLANGLRVVVAEHRRVPLLAVALVIGSGASQDPSGAEGLATLVGGALRRGTTSRDAQAFTAATERLAGEIDVDVGHDRTIVTADFLARDAAQGLALVGEMVIEPGFRRDEIDRERRELLAHVRARQEDASALASLCFASFLYGRHPYGRPLEGGPSSLDRLDRGDVRAYHDRHYRPNNAVLVAVGAVPPGQLQTEIRAAFGRWEPGLPAPPAPADPPIGTADRRLLLVDKPGATQAHIRVGGLGIARRDPDYVVAQVANTALGGGFTSRLMQALRVERSLTYGVWSSFTARRARGDFRIGTFTAVPTAAKTLEIVLAELERYRREPPGEAETEKARAYLRGQFPLELETAAALATRLAEVEWYGLGVAEVTGFGARVGAVTPPEVAAFVERALPSPTEATIVVIGPARDLAPALAPLGRVETVTMARCTEAGEPGAIGPRARLNGATLLSQGP